MRRNLRSVFWGTDPAKRVDSLRPVLRRLPLESCTGKLDSQAAKKALVVRARLAAAVYATKEMNVLACIYLDLGYASDTPGLIDDSPVWNPRLTALTIYAYMTRSGVVGKQVQKHCEELLDSQLFINTLADNCNKKNIPVLWNQLEKWWRDLSGLDEVKAKALVKPFRKKL